MASHSLYFLVYCPENSSPHNLGVAIAIYFHYGVLILREYLSFQGG